MRQTQSTQACARTRAQVHAHTRVYVRRTQARRDGDTVRHPGGVDVSRGQAAAEHTRPCVPSESGRGWAPVTPQTETTWSALREGNLENADRWTARGREQSSGRAAHGPQSSSYRLPGAAWTREPPGRSEPATPPASSTQSPPYAKHASVKVRKHFNFHQDTDPLQLPTVRELGDGGNIGTQTRYLDSCQPS